MKQEAARIRDEGGWELRNVSMPCGHAMWTCYVDMLCGHAYADILMWTIISRYVEDFVHVLNRKRATTVKR